VFADGGADVDAAKAGEWTGKREPELRGAGEGEGVLPGEGAAEQAATGMEKTTRRMDGNGEDDAVV
jgi:hypothetical protein